MGNNPSNPAQGLDKRNAHHVKDEVMEDAPGARDNTGANQDNILATYEGPRVADLPHGEGKLFYPAEDTLKRSEYSGHFVKGKRQGYGTLQWANGTMYVGEWENDKINGKGKLSWNGMYYDGYWKENKMDGYGEMVYRNGNRYIGMWSNGVFSGHGELSYSRKDARQRQSYVGEFKNGERHGRGRMEWTNGAWYDGEWSDGKRHGQGTHVFPTGESYSGGWFYGKRHGYGVRRYSDGVVWEGNWNMDKRHGQGVLIEAHGRRKPEFYDNGRPQGQAPQDAQALLVLTIEKVAQDPRYQEGIQTLPEEIQQKIHAAQKKPEEAEPERDLQNLANLKMWFGM